MKVTLQSHGGFAAGIAMATPARTVDSVALHPDQAAELARLVAAAQRDRAGRRPGATAPAGPGPGTPARDAMSYSVQIEDGDRIDSLQLSDADLAPDSAALLDFLNRLS